jgi:hypothetical protein
MTEMAGEMLDAARRQACKSALLRARATMACLAHPDWSRCQPPTCESTYPYYREREAPFELHRTAASALLDGFSVEEVTRAGG